MKNKPFLNWLIILLGVVAIAGFSLTPALADDAEIQDESFGQNYQYTWIPSVAFAPTSSSMTYESTNAYRYRTGGGNNMAAAINLPSGAYLHSTQTYFYDSNVTNEITISVYRFYSDNSYELLGSCHSSGTPGYSSCNVYCDETIRNGDSIYMVYVYLTANNITNRFKGVRLYWKRQISPAPATATFSDIGPGHWAFQSVEALAASGITQGCPDCAGCFCPDKPVSRAAMAAFLARALGLHWDSLDGY